MLTRATHGKWKVYAKPIILGEPSVAMIPLLNDSGEFRWVEFEQNQRNFRIAKKLNEGDIVEFTEDVNVLN